MLYTNTHISSTGNFNVSLEHLGEKALHALISLRKNQTDWQIKSLLWLENTQYDEHFPVTVKFGELTRNKILKGETAPQLKKTNLHFCKRFLEVSNKASNAACRGELGRFPLICRIDIDEKILNYILYLLQKDEDSIALQALLVSINLHSNSNYSRF